MHLRRVAKADAADPDVAFVPSPKFQGGDQVIFTGGFLELGTFGQTSRSPFQGDGH